MDATYIRNRIRYILTSEDPEDAHRAEDALLEEFVRNIASGALENPAECAGELVVLLNTKRTRWYD